MASLPALLLVPTTARAICIALGPTLPYAAAPLAAMLVLALLPMLMKMIAPPSRTGPTAAALPVSS